MPSIPLGIVASEFSFPEVTGGTLTSDATYYYRTFTANGTLEVKYANVEMNFLLVGGGGSGVAYGYAGEWYSSDGGKFIYFGPGGAAGGYVDAQFATSLKSDMNVARTSTSYAIVIGAGGATFPSAGNETSYTSNYGSRQAAGGGGPTIAGPYGGGYSGYLRGGTRADIGSSGSPWYEQPGYSGYGVEYIPHYVNGGGGAGAYSQGGDASNFGPGQGGASTSVYGLDFGGGSAGCWGGYEGNAYDYWNNAYWANDLPSSRPNFSSGTNAGISSMRDDVPVTSGVANRGGGGGSGLGAGSGGSGIVVFRYLRSQVGG